MYRTDRGTRGTRVFGGESGRKRQRYTRFSSIFCLEVHTVHAPVLTEVNPVHALSCSGTSGESVRNDRGKSGTRAQLLGYIR